MHPGARGKARGFLGVMIVLTMAAIAPAQAGDSQVQPGQSRPSQAERNQAQDSPTALPVEQIESIVREYLLRNPEVIYQALQELQRRQAEATAELIGPIDRVISSPLARARQTASYFGTAVEIDERWIELDYGEWEGRRVRDVEPLEP